MGRATAAERGHGVRIEHAQRPRHLHVGDHEGEGLVVARLAAPELGHRVVVGRVARQVIATDALHGEDPAGAERFGDGVESGSRFRPRSLPAGS